VPGTFSSLSHPNPGSHTQSHQRQHDGEDSGALVALILLEPDEANVVSGFPPPPPLQESGGPTLGMGSDGYNTPSVHIPSKETGISLVNVPMESPLQTSLLGTISAHEREKGLMEGRQHKFDGLQKQQSDMVQIGSVCGSQFSPGSPPHVTPSDSRDSSQDNNSHKGKHNSSFVSPRRRLTKPQAQHAACQATVHHPGNNRGANEKGKRKACQGSWAGGSLASVDTAKPSVFESGTL
jgi:hypothetical protein